MASVRPPVKHCAAAVPFRRCGLAEGNAGNKKNGQGCSKQDTAKELKDGFEKGFSLGKTRPTRDVTKKKEELCTSAVNRTRNRSEHSAAKLRRGKIFTLTKTDKGSDRLGRPWTLHSWGIC